MKHRTGSLIWGFILTALLILLLAGTYAFCNYDIRHKPWQSLEADAIQKQKTEIVRLRAALAEKQETQTIQDWQAPADPKAEYSMLFFVLDALRDGNELTGLVNIYLAEDATGKIWRVVTSGYAEKEDVIRGYRGKEAGRGYEKLDPTLEEVKAFLRNREIFEINRARIGPYVR